MFSSRLPGGLPPNAITQAVETHRRAQRRLIDLTETNPTQVGLPYPPGLLQSLGDDSGRFYSPESLGLSSAREAAAAECARSGADVDPARIVLTTSTSEAYSLLFKLLCDPGDAVLVPRPSYPLFESLAGLEAVTATPYLLEYHGRWEIDRDSLERALTPRTRAVLVVTPNNPTGSMLRQADREWLVGLAGEQNLALISDEVFADYRLQPAADASFLSGEERVLTFVLGGLSKSAGLPQVKLGWIVVGGPDERAVPALARLDVICDTYLSVSTPVQLAARKLIEAGASIRAAIQERVRRNLDALRTRLKITSPMTLLEPEGGWSAVVRVPATEGEESLVLRLLREHDVLVHPGFFFDFASEAYIVVSLLPEPDAFDAGVARVLKGVGEAVS